MIRARQGRIHEIRCGRWAAAPISDLSHCGAALAHQKHRRRPKEEGTLSRLLLALIDPRGEHTPRGRRRRPRTATELAARECLTSHAHDPQGERTGTGGGARRQQGRTGKAACARRRRNWCSHDSHCVRSLPSASKSIFSPGGHASPPPGSAAPSAPANSHSPTTRNFRHHRCSPRRPRPRAPTAHPRPRRWAPRPGLLDPFFHQIFPPPVPIASRLRHDSDRRPPAQPLKGPRRQINPTQSGSCPPLSPLALSFRLPVPSSLPRVNTCSVRPPSTPRPTRITRAPVHIDARHQPTAPWRHTATH